MKDYLRYREEERIQKRPPKLPPVVWYILGAITLIFVAGLIYQLVTGRF